MKKNYLFKCATVGMAVMCLCFSFTGCGSKKNENTSTTTAAQNASSPVEGYWVCDEWKMYYHFDGNKASGFSFGSLEETEFTYDDSKLTIDGEDLSYKISGDTLSLGDEETTFEFKKIDKASYESAVNDLAANYSALDGSQSFDLSNIDSSSVQVGVGVTMTINGITYRNDGNGTYIVSDNSSSGNSSSSGTITSNINTSGSTNSSYTNKWHGDAEQALQNSERLASFNILKNQITIDDIIAKEGQPASTNDYSSYIQYVWNTQNGFSLTAVTDPNKIVTTLYSSDYNTNTWNDSGNDLSKIDASKTYTYNEVNELLSAGTIAQLSYKDGLKNGKGTYLITWYDSNRNYVEIVFDGSTDTSLSIRKSA